jgi:zinc protease
MSTFKKCCAVVLAGALSFAFFQGKRGQSSVIPEAKAEQTLAVSLPFEKYTLANGLEVILHEDPRTPVVAVNVWYHVGSKDESPGKNGFAHLFEHVMFQGSRHVEEDTFFKYLEAAGASDRNGTTNTDRTNYYETVPANQLELVLWLESDRMAFLLDHADQKTFESQREVVKNERRQNYENSPYGLVRQFVQAEVYPKDHPYHLLTIGTPEDLDAATLTDVRTFFRTFYVPNNATLVIAGAFDKERTKSLVEKYFGPIVKGAKPPVITSAPMPKLSGQKRLDVEANVKLARVQLTWPTPKMFAAGDADLDVLSHVLAMGKSGRLYQRLVHDMQIVQSVYSYQSSSQLGSEYSIVATIKEGKSADDVLKVIDEELDKLRKEAPKESEVKRAKTQLIAQMVFGMEKVTARANLLNHYNQVAGDPGFFSKDLGRYQAVTTASVKKATEDFLPKERRILTVVTPNSSAPRAGQLKGGTK